jgi:hypothetical protein
MNADCTSGITEETRFNVFLRELCVQTIAFAVTAGTRKLATGSTRRADAQPLAVEFDVGLLLRDRRHDVGSFDVWSSGDRDAFRDRDRFNRGDALLAGIFDDPLERRDSLCHRLLHEFTLSDDIRTAARDPRYPDELLWLSTDILVLWCLRADRFAVFAIRSAGARNTHLLTLHAPACRRDLLVLTHQSTHFATTVRTTTTMSTASTCGVANIGEHWCERGRNHRSQKKST